MRDDLLSMLDEITEEIAIKQQNPLDGGWSDQLVFPHQTGARPDSDVWSTAEVVLWLGQYDAHKYQRQIEDGLRFLENTQHIDANVPDNEVDGGWGRLLDRPSEATATTLALLAFVRHAEQERRNTRNLVQARDWLTRHINQDGGWSLLPQQHSSAFNTCWGCIALSECLDVTDLADPVISASVLPRAVTLIETSKKAGGWGQVLSEPADAIGTGYCTYLLQQMDRQTAANQGIQHLLHIQRNNGGWEPGPMQSPIEATAWALLALQNDPVLRQQHKIALAIESGLKYLCDLYIPAQGWPEKPGGKAKLWATYYACLAILRQIDADREDEGEGGLMPSRRRRRVFIVHGHHQALRSEVKEIVRSVGLDPVVLEEKPDIGSNTIIEKFEYYAKQEGVDYAVVLCTPDDINVAELAATPRANVLVELGYFFAKLGRAQVCILLDPAAKLPSDVDGIISIDIRKEGWKEKFRELLRLFQQSRDAIATE